MMWCSVSVYARCWTICRWFFEWSKPDDYLPLLMAHWLPLAPNKGSFWRLLRGKDDDVFSSNARSHRSTTAGTVWIKLKTSCEKVRIERMVSQLISVTYANKWPSILWLSVVSFPVVTVYSSEGLGTDKAQCTPHWSTGGYKSLFTL